MEFSWGMVAIVVAVIILAIFLIIYYISANDAENRKLYFPQQLYSPSTPPTSSAIPRLPPQQLPPIGSDMSNATDLLGDVTATATNGYIESSMPEDVVDLQEQGQADLESTPVQISQVESPPIILTTPNTSTTTSTGSDVAMPTGGVLEVTNTPIAPTNYPACPSLYYSPDYVYIPKATTYGVGRYYTLPNTTTLQGAMAKCSAESQCAGFETTSQYYKTFFTEPQFGFTENPCVGMFVKKSYYDANRGIFP